MAEMGILDLEVQVNLEHVEQNLDRLTGALRNVKEKVGDGINLSGISTQILKICKAIDDGISGSTIIKLGEFGDALGKLKGLNNLVINIRTSGNAETAVEKIKKNSTTSAEEVKGASESLVNNLQEGMSELDLLVEKVGILRSELDEGIDSKAFDDKKVVNYALNIMNLEEKIEKLQEVSDREGQAEFFKSFSEEFSTIDAYAMKLEALQEKLEKGIDTGTWDNEKIANAILRIQNLREKIESMKEAVGNQNPMLTMNEDAMKAADSFLELHTQADRLLMQINALKQQLGEGIVSGNMDEAKLVSLSDKIERLQQKYEKLTEKTKETIQTTEDLAEAFENVESFSSSGMENVDSAVSSAEGSLIDTQSTVSEGFMEVDESVNQVKDSSEQLTGKMKDLDKELKQKKKDTKDASFSFDSLKKSLKNVFPFVDRIRRQFGKVLIRRSITAVIRNVASSFKEGVENVYNYSKAIDSSFAPSMDSAASTLLQMKNSIGAAVAPLIQSLIPVLQTVVNWFITAVNYVNQFFALLRGQATWTRALPATTTAFGKQEKAAKKAGNAIKDLLADWDELNIIQSNTSGAGSSTGKSSVEEYLNMFEEVSTFDKDVKGVFDFLKDNMNDVLGIVEKIGAAILLWNISSAFSGIIARIAGLAGAAFTIAVVAEVSTLFTNKFLETGNPGWLVGDILATLLGGLATKTLLDKVIGGGAGTVGLALAFAISAGATIKANIARTDIGALSKLSILADVVAALKGAVVGGSIGWMIGHTLGSALVGGAVGLLGTFGIAIGLKADAQVIADGITDENIKAKLIGIGSLGIAGAALGAATGGAAGAAGMAMLFGGASIATFGVAIGIHAINTTAEAGEITKDVIEKNLLSAGIIGAGLALVAGAVIGSAAAVAVTAVGGAGLALGALFVVEAIIAKQPKKIQWGDYKATKEEIEAFVTDQLYRDPPSVTISTLKTTIDKTTDIKKTLGDDISNLIGTIYAMKLGILTTPEEMKTQIDTFVSDYNKTTAQMQETLQVSLSVAPITTGEETDTDQTEGILKRSSARWSELNGIMADLGEKLADAYKVAYDARLKGNLDEAAENTIKEISDMMTKVAQAIATGQAKAKAGHAIKMQLQNLSQDSLNALLDEVKKQRDQLIEELTKTRTEAAEGILAQQYAYEELAKYRLEEVGGDVNDATYKHYTEMAKQAKADYEAVLANMKKDVETAADNLMDDKTKEELRQAVMKYMKRDITLDNFMNHTGGEFGALTEAYRELFAGEESVLQGEDAKQNVYDLMTNFILASFQGEDKDTVRKAITSNAVSFSDFVNKTIIDTLADALGIEGENRQLWDMYVDELLNGATAEPEFDMSGVTEPLEEAKKSAEEYSNTLDDLYDKIRAGAGYTGQDKIDYFAGLYDQFGSFNVQNAMRTLGIDTSFMAEWFEKQNRVNPGAAVTSGQIVNGTTYSGVIANPDGSVNVDGKNVEDGVKNGTSEGFAALVDKQTTTNEKLDQLLKKEFTVKMYPTSRMGFFVRNAVETATNVTGDNPP